jgi:predicted TPR repeat methyltransferase
MVAAMHKPTPQSPDSVRVLQADKAVLEARRLRESGKTEDAAKLIAAVVRAEPQHLGAVTLMASMAMQTGAPDLAIYCYSRAVALSPKSHDLLYALGNAFIAAKRPAEAVTALKKALTLRANDPATFRALGQAQLDMGNRDDALKSFRKTLSILPYDKFASHFVTALSGEGAKQSGNYVADLFDTYADKFDAHLTGGLDYRVPRLVRDLVADRAPFGTVLDLGCGTGLVGVELKDMATSIDGTDIAPLMTRKTIERGIYRHVRTGDTVELLGTDPDLAGPYDLVTAGDVFVYVGPLETTFAAVAKVLVPTGLFAFSVEAGTGDGVTLRSTGRFSHSPFYIQGLAEAHGFTILVARDVTLRQEHNQPIAGTLYLMTGP